MNKKELKKILYKHNLWLKGEGGKPANLENADLRNKNLHHTSLTGVNLRNANFSGSMYTYVDFTGAMISGAVFHHTYFNCVNFQGANLQLADFTDSTLIHVNFNYTDLNGAIFKCAHISDINFRNATLDNITFKHTKNKIFPEIFPDLYLLKMQSPETKLKAWKYLLNNSTSPFYEYRYKVGKTYTEKIYSTDEKLDCSMGFNVATLQWCLKNNEHKTGKFIEVEFSAKDIIAVPFATDGEFRVKKLKVLRKLTRKQAEKEMLRYLNDNKS